MIFLSNIDLNQNQLVRPRIHNLATSPGGVAGQIYYDTTTHSIFFYDGGANAWKDMGGGIRSIVGTSPISATPSGTQYTISIAAASGSTAGSMSINDFNKLAASTNLNTAGTLVQRDGSGNFNANVITATKITGLATPVSGSDAVNKDYVDLAVQGIDWKNSVKAATTANITLSGTQTIDGVSLIAGDRILVKNQTTASQNGIYVVAAGSWARANDMLAGSDASNASVFVENGTTQSDTAWVCTNDTGGSGAASSIVGTGDLTFIQFSGAAQILAGAGMTKTGNTLDVVAADASIVVAADNIRVGTDGTTIETAVGVGIRVKDSGITASKIATSAIGTGLTGGGGTAISVVSYTPATNATVVRVQKVTGTIGGGVAVGFSHNLGTTDIADILIKATSAVGNIAVGDILQADWTIASSSSINITAIGSNVNVAVYITA